jgi:hypothetical protein
VVDIERVVTLDELMDRVPPELVRDAEGRRIEMEQTSAQSITPESESNMTKEMSKAKRIRNYLEDNPDARNKEVVEALSDYSVTAADVANVKSLSKRTGEPISTKKESSAKSRGNVADVVGDGTKGPTINWQELDAGVAFVKAAGSVQRAQHLLIIIEQIKAC